NDPAVLFTLTTSVSRRASCAEIVLFPAPVPVVVIVAGPDPVASNVNTFEATLLTVLPKFEKSLLNVSEPIVEDASSVTTRSEVWSGLLAVAAPLKATSAPTVLGTPAGVQFPAVFQLPPPGWFHTDAAVTALGFESIAAANA